MKRYVLFVGGGGARAAEALLVAASAGVLRAEKMDVLLADTDHRGLRSAELLRAKYADYGRMQQAMRHEERQDGLRPFGVQLHLHSWPRELPGGAMTLSELTAQREEDALLCQALFGTDASQLDLNVGFHGERTLGQTVFAGMLHTSLEDPQDEMTLLLAQMNAELDEGEEVRVAICGSVTGGTGAAGIPLLARHVHAGTGGRARIGAVLLAATGEHEDPAKAKEALSQIAGESACSAVCLLGLPRSSCSDAPAEHAHLADWLAVYCMDILLHRPAWPEGLFTVQTDMSPLSWEIFGKAASRYRQAYGRLIKASAAFTQVIAPQVEKRLKRPFFLRDRFFGWYAHFFRKADQGRAERLQDLEQLRRLMRVVQLWMGGLMHTLPPEMTHGEELRNLQAEAQAHYAGMVELSGHLAILQEDAQQHEAFEESRVYRNARAEEESEAAQAMKRIDAVRQEMDNRRAKMDGLCRSIGGDASLRLLQQALQRVDESSDELQERYREANRRIDHAESIAAEHDLYRIADARTRLERMLRHQRALSAQQAFVREDVQKASEDAQRFRRAALRGIGEGNGMFDARLLDRLLLREHRVKAKEVETAYPAILNPADGRTFKTMLKRIRKAPVNEAAPVVGLLQALIAEAMEEV